MFNEQPKTDNEIYKRIFLEKGSVETQRHLLSDAAAEQAYFATELSKYLENNIDKKDDEAKAAGRMFSDLEERVAKTKHILAEWNTSLEKRKAEEALNDMKK